MAVSKAQQRFTIYPAQINLADTADGDLPLVDCKRQSENIEPVIVMVALVAPSISVKPEEGSQRAPPIVVGWEGGWPRADTGWIYRPPGCYWQSSSRDISKASRNRDECSGIDR